MRWNRSLILAAIAGTFVLGGRTEPASAQEIRGTVKKVDVTRKRLVLQKYGVHEDVVVNLAGDATFDLGGDRQLKLGELKTGMRVAVTNAVIASRVLVEPEAPRRTIFGEFWYNFRHNLFKPLLLFFYMGFLVPIFRVKFEFPYVIYQGVTIYLLIAIGWKGGEELSQLSAAALGPVVAFMGVGFVTNFFVGILAYLALSMMTRMRRVDKATVAGYYGSDSAGTFVTATGVLATIHVAYDAYMPVMLAVMEIPGCLVALYLVSRLRHQGMDPAGTMPNEPGYDPNARPPVIALDGGHGSHESAAVQDEKELSLEQMNHGANGNGNGNGSGQRRGSLDLKLLHEVLFNPGLYLLFGGIIVGFISGTQGKEVTREDDNFFILLFQGVLCLFLLEMGMTASRKLKDLRTAGPGFIAFGILGPPVFATIGIFVAHAFSLLAGIHFELGTYVLFAVLCGAASYIAVPAVQRLAIPEASPTLPLAASLGLTFSFNVTIGIPIYYQIAKAVVGSSTG